MSRLLSRDLYMCSPKAGRESVAPSGGRRRQAFCLPLPPDRSRISSRCAPSVRDDVTGSLCRLCLILLSRHVVIPATGATNVATAEPGSIHVLAKGRAGVGCSERWPQATSVLPPSAAR